MHYIAPGRKNLVWHLRNVHGVLNSTKDMMKSWTEEELQTDHNLYHKEMKNETHQLSLSGGTSER